MQSQSATLRRALEVLNAVCKAAPVGRDESQDFRASNPPRTLMSSAAPVDLEEWREPFVQWLDSACALHPRVFGGVAALHLAFCDWEIARNGVPCTKEAFERLLAELGFLTGEVGGTLLVSGLTFRVDVEAAGL
jgi:hypothetical protein